MEIEKNCRRFPKWEWTAGARTGWADTPDRQIFVIPTDEEMVFIEDTVALCEGRYDVHTKFHYRFQDPGYRNALRELARQ